MFKYITGEDVFLNFTAYTCEGDWPVVARFVLLTLLEYSCNVCTPPVFWYGSCVKALLEDEGLGKVLFLLLVP